MSIVIIISSNFIRVKSLAFVVIGWSGYFGYSFTTLNRKLLNSRVKSVLILGIGEIGGTYHFGTYHVG